MRELPSLAVIGATGTVGTVLCELLSARKNVWGPITVADLPGAVGKTVVVRGEELTVQAVDPSLFDNIDVAMFGVGADVAAQWAPVAAARGAIVVDSSPAFRMDPEVPLVVPELNAVHARQRAKGIIAGPACTTMAMILPIGALHREYGLRELIISTYQAATAVGAQGARTLLDQMAKVSGDPALGSRAGNVRQVVGDDVMPFAAPLALNVVPWAGAPRDDGWSTEELAVRDETRKVLGLPTLKVSVTCVLVPVVTGHSLSIHAVFQSEVDAEEAREVLRHSPGVIVVDDPAAGEFPMPVDAVGTDPIWVGRIRRSLDDPRALDIFVTGDNLRKGSALNTAQIAELIAEEHR